MKSIEELEGEVWGEPNFGSYVVTECHNLRKIPIEELTPEQIRLSLSQDIGAKHTFSRALELLEENNLEACGHHNDGTLARSILKSKEIERDKEDAVLDRIISAVNKATEILKEQDPEWYDAEEREAFESGILKALALKQNKPNQSLLDNA